MPNNNSLKPVRELGRESATIDFDDFLGVAPKTGLEDDLVSVCH